MQLECVKRKVERKRKEEEENQRKNDQFMTQNKQKIYY